MDLRVCRETESVVYSPWNINDRLVRLCGQLGVPIALPACGVLIAKGHSRALPRGAKTLPPPASQPQAPASQPQALSRLRLSSQALRLSASGLRPQTSSYQITPGSWNGAQT